MDEEYGSEISDVNAAYGTIEEIICDDECDELTGSISELTIDEAFEETEVQDVPENLYMTDNEVEIEESEYKAEDFSG